MPDLINLTCPSCGGKLQITSDIDRFSCGYCGNELIVQRNGGAITIAPVVEGLKGVKTGVDKTASELAIIRLEKEISMLLQQRSAIATGADNGCFLLLSLVVVSLIVLSVTTVLAGGDYMKALLFLSAGIALYGLVFWLKKVRSSNIEKANKELATINQMIAGKKQELEKHQNIVRNG